MAGFGSSGRYGFGGGGDKEKLTGRIEDIKAAPQHGEKRLIVRDKQANKSVAIDIPTSESLGLERKETYHFMVEEKHARRDGQGGRAMTPTQRTYQCDDRPAEYGSGSSWDNVLNRFGDNDRGGSGRRGRTFKG